ncbi:unnamed protein product, partial [Closterium sp. Naga37s-1]
RSAGLSYPDRGIPKEMAIQADIRRVATSRVSTGPHPRHQVLPDHLDYVHTGARLWGYDAVTVMEPDAGGVRSGLDL